MFLLTGSDSPVSVDSSICRPSVSISLRSAGTRPPTFKETMSPGTSSSDGISYTLPSRTTWQVYVVSRFSSATDFSLRYSCVKPRVTTMVTATAIPTASFTLWIKSDTRAEASSSKIRGSVNFFKNKITGDSPPASVSLFAPSSLSRFSDSPRLRPAGVVSRKTKTSSASNTWACSDFGSWYLCKLIFWFPARRNRCVNSNLCCQPVFIC
ncbi:hypothetical protein BMS3Abin16_01715 [archaeon BMS3Abin16]|nr:hypothetical protein BMS3Abin16_01715 [archaeon BMS3Abin16]